MAQFSKPDADQAANSWTTTPLWSKVEEGVSAADGTVVTSDAVGNNTNTSNMDLKLDDVTDPGGNTGYIIRAHIRHDVASRTMTGHLELWEGIPDTGTLRGALVQTAINDSTLTTYSYELTTGEADAIGDFTDLYIRAWGRGTSGGPARSMIVDAVEFEVPDAGTTHQEDGVDGVDIGDTGTADLIVKPSQTDGVDIGDSATMIATFVPAGTDGVDIGDTGTMIATFVIAQTDGIDLGDSATVAVVKAVADTDGFDIGDSATEALIVKPSQTDGVDIGDIGTMIATYVPAAADGFDIGDSATVIITYVLAVSDGVDIGDSATEALIVKPSQTDGVDIGDIGTMIATYVPAAPDGVKISDAGTVVIITGDLGSSTLRIVWG